MRKIIKNNAKLNKYTTVAFTSIRNAILKKYFLHFLTAQLQKLFTRTYT